MHLYLYLCLCLACACAYYRHTHVHAHAHVHAHVVVQVCRRVYARTLLRDAAARAGARFLRSAARRKARASPRRTGSRRQRRRRQRCCQRRFRGLRRYTPAVSCGLGLVSGALFESGTGKYMSKNRPLTLDVSANIFKI